MKHLHYRLSAGMLAIMLIVGIAFHAIDRYSVRMYYDELSQRLNASLAMYVAGSAPLIENGAVNRAALTELAERAMVINPTAEIYLLDAEGRILGHALAPGAVETDHVDMRPVNALLSASQSLPIRGTDPANPGIRKVFSAYPVSDAAAGERPAGYVYVVLGGSQFAAVAEAVAGSDRQRMVAAGIVLLVLAGFVAGALLFSLLTRRLRNLTAEVTEFTTSGFAPDSTVANATRRRDELDTLRNACHTMAETITSQLASLEENDRLRRELVTNISHDLRTPLTTMQGYIETLIIKNDSLDDTTRRQYLGIARRHASHLGRLVHDLFELAMLDASRVNPVFEEFSLVELIHDVVQEFELEASEDSVSLEVERPDRDISVCADIRLIQRVLENLMANAIRHTPSGGSISIAVRPARGAVGVSVTDTGPGIPAEDLPHIFDRYYQGCRDASGNNGSTGLGLAIARRILELHGSEIRVVSQEQQGARFDFELPLQARAA